MKTIKLLLAAAFFTGISNVSFAQSQKIDSFAVSGNCGSCKKTIEKAAKDGGASTAEWNKDSKILVVKYNAKGTDLAKIQQKIAASGYDNAGVKASDKAYKNLHSCCQYDRDAAITSEKK